MTWFPLLIYMWAGSSKWGTFLTPYMLSILQLKCRHCLAAMQTCDHRTCSSVRCHTRHHLQVSSSQSPEMFFHNAGEMFPHACWLFWISFFNSSYDSRYSFFIRFSGLVLLFLFVCGIALFFILVMLYNMHMYDIFWIQSSYASILHFFLIQWYFWWTFWFWA